MNWGNGIFRLWVAGSFLWIAFWAERLVCLKGETFFEGECGTWTVTYEYGLAALAALTVFWAARGLMSPRLGRTDLSRQHQVRLHRAM